MSKPHKKTYTKMYWIYHRNQSKYYPEIKLRVPLQLVSEKYAPCAVIGFEVEIYDDLTIVFKPKEVLGIDQKCLDKIREQASTHNDTDG